MTPTEYWEGDVYMAEAYRKAYQYKLQKENSDKYLMGLYNFHAFAIALSNIHFDKRKHKPNSYLKEPFDLFKTEEEKKKKKAKKEEAEKQKLVNYLNSIKKSWDAKNTKEQNNGTTN